MRDADPSSPSFAEPEAWVVFLDALTRPPAALTPRRASAIRTLWAALRDEVGPALPLPRVEPLDDDVVRLSWSDPTWYAEVDVGPDDGHGRCAMAWFFRDRSSGRAIGSEASIVGSPDALFMRALTAVVAR
ncbi:MAG: hypothetical protein H6733_12020 [Alphaproteobacteria bacterium]|nr:hypothetical protein [Alphaproteobacteria bacterium]